MNYFNLCKFQNALSFPCPPNSKVVNPPSLPDLHFSLQASGFLGWLPVWLHWKRFHMFTSIQKFLLIIFHQKNCLQGSKLWLIQWCAFVTQFLAPNLFSCNFATSFQLTTRVKKWKSSCFVCFMENRTCVATCITLPNYLHFILWATFTKSIRHHY